jgi:uncharacterized protein YrzB (UPF0473 family)
MNLLLKLKKQIAILAIMLCASTAFAQHNNESAAPAAYTPSEYPTLILTPTNFFVSPPVRDLPVCDDLSTFDGFIVPRDGANTSHDMSAKRKRKLAHLNAAGRSSTSIDPKMQMNIAPDDSNLNRAPIVNFDDVSNSAAPPDPSMAVGPNHIVTMQNGLWAVYDKNGAIAAGFPKTLNDPLSGPNHADNAGDPVVMYDREADRWFISQFQLSGNPALSDNVFLIGISTTPDPTGAFNVYEYELPAGNDYPHYGVWGDSYVTAGNFTGSQKVYTFNRTKMLAGDATAEIAGFSPANLGVGGFAAPIPVHSEAAGAATGDIKIVYYQDDAFSSISTDHIGMWNIDMDWTSAATINASTISDKVEIPTAAFDAVIAGGFANIAQPGTTQRIDAIVGAVMNMSHWYKFPTHESILLNWVVEIQDGTQKSGIRWVELRSTNDGATWSVFQEGTFTDPAETTVALKESVFMGCISMDSAGNIGLGYTKAGTSTFPSLYYTGRMDGDPLGTMTVPEELAIAGTTSVTSNDRYGDYGQGVRDPVDDLTFWVTSEYSGDPGFNRKSRVYSFKLEPELSLEIICPADTTIACGDDTSPANTGTAIAESDCDPDPVVSFTDEVEETCGNTQIITRTWLAVDDCGNDPATCIQMITIQDIIAPTVVCPDDILVNNDPDQCTAIVTFDITATDTCGDATITLVNGLASGSEFPIGDTLNQFEIVDDCGNTTLCIFTVTVENSEIPEAICQNITVELDENGMATITTVDVNGGAGTICESANTTIDIDTFDCSNIGDNNVVLTVVDNMGGVTSCTAIVTIEDNLLPEVICTPITVALDETGMAIVTGEMIAGESTDNCAIASIEVSTTMFDCMMVGEHDVTITVIDVNGNSNSCDSTVTVVDATLPTAICTNLTLELDADGLATIEVADIDNGSFDNCGNVTVEIDTTTFTCDDLGVNNVVLTVTDDNGNVSECNAMVTIEDNIFPMIVCQDLEFELNEDGDTIFITPAMIDNGSTDNCNIESYELDITMFDCDDLGDNEVQLTITDTAGNEVTCIAIVTINPISDAPVADCQDVSVILDENGMATIVPQNISANEAFDICGYVLTIDVDTFTCEDAGNIVPVTLTVTNAQGESDSCTADVFVVDNIVPTIVCPEETVIIAALAPYELPNFVVDGTVTVADNCLDQLIITQDPAVGTFVEAGETEITITVTDPSGNTASCEFDIFVDPSLTVEASEILKTLQLFPNPAATSFSMTMSDAIIIDKITLLDISGRIIKDYSISEIRQNTFSVADVAKASYFVFIETNLGMHSMQLIKR